MAGELKYPPNYDFDPETLEPRGDLAVREWMLRATAPELFGGGHELADVGSNKGFLSLLLAECYDVVNGYEPIKKYVDFSNELAQAHGLDNVRFVQAGWQAVTKAEVVYCGGVHHHAYNGLLVNGRDPFEFIRHVADCAERVLIIDGPWDLKNPKHNTAGALAEQNKWRCSARKGFTIMEHSFAISAEFSQVRIGPSGTGDRQIVVWKRK